MGFVGKIKTGETSHSVGSTLYGTCSTLAATATKEVNIEGIDALITGLTIYVKFGSPNTADNPVLKLNSLPSSEIPKPIYSYGSVPPGKNSRESWAGGEVVPLVFDGNAWRICNGSSFRFNALFNAIYPIGSIYMSTNSVSPATLFGWGTWERVTGRFLLGASDVYTAGEEGGSEAVTLTSDHIPTHTHSITGHTHTINSHTHTLSDHRHGILHQHDIPEHAHAVPTHTHTIESHNHTVPDHNHTITAHVHGLGDHTHSLNNHSHTIPALTGTATANGAHQHTENNYTLGLTKDGEAHSSADTFALSATAGGTGNVFDVYQLNRNEWNWPSESKTTEAGSHTHSVTTVASTTGNATGNTGASSGNTGSSGDQTTSSVTGAKTGYASLTTERNSSPFNTSAVDLTTGTPLTEQSGLGGAGSTGSASLTTNSAGSGQTGSYGGGSAHNNMPPYLAVYIWKRTA